MRDYSGDEKMLSELRELMQEAPDEETRREFEKFINKIQSM
jgi:CRISPR/Cas system CSM-associated protein Csm2 small subunit